MNIQHNRDIVLQRIAQAIRHDQPSNVRLIAVSKTIGSDQIQSLYQCGQHDFGENYIQEWHTKAMQLKHVCPDIIWHIIGHIQSNKSRLVAEHAHWVHTIDRPKIAQRLSQQRPEHLPALQACIEINISASDHRHGIHPSHMISLAKEIMTLPRIQLRGIMCVASNDIHKARDEFTHMHALFQQLHTLMPTADTLSMGMSHDFTLAIEHGATMIRVGNAIFGQRKTKA